jgi:hypothetical protein
LPPGFQDMLAFGLVEALMGRRAGAFSGEQKSRMACGVAQFVSSFRVRLSTGLPC